MDLEPLHGLKRSGLGETLLDGGLGELVKIIFLLFGENTFSFLLHKCSIAKMTNFSGVPQTCREYFLFSHFLVLPCMTLVLISHQCFD